MKLSTRTRWIIGVPFFGGLAYLWYLALAGTPRKTFLYFVGLSLGLAIILEWIARKLQIARGGVGRYVLELAFAVATMIVASWLMSAR